MSGYVVVSFLFPAKNTDTDLLHPLSQPEEVDVNEILFLLTLQEP